MRYLSRVLPLIVAAVLAAAGAASARPHWSSPIAIGHADGTSTVSVTGAGTALMAIQPRFGRGIQLVRVDRAGRRRVVQIEPPAYGWIQGVPVLAANPAGDAVVSWTYDDRSVPATPDCHCDSLCCERVAVSYVPRAGPARTPRTLSQGGASAFGPTPAIGPGGVAVVAWRWGVDVQAAVAGPRGRFGAPRTMAPGFNGEGELVESTAVLPPGRPMVAWGTLPDQGDARLLVRTAAPGSARFGASRTVAREPGGHGLTPFLYVLGSPRGDLLSWSFNGNLRTRWAPAGMSMGPPIFTTIGPAAFSALAAVNSRGVVWLIGPVQEGRLRWLRAVRLVDGRPGPVRAVPGPPFDELPGIGVDGLGRAVLVWTSGGEDRDVWAVRTDVAGRFGRPVRISHRSRGRGFVTSPQVAVNARGEALAVWKDGRAFPPNTLLAARFFAR